MKPLTLIRAVGARAYHTIRSIGGRYRCPVCERRVGRFTPLGRAYLRDWETHGFDHQVADFEMLNAESYACPHCGASDRDRVCALYVRERLADEAAPLRLVDFAPSVPLRKMLRSLSQVRYRSADLYMDDVDDRIDITAMPTYADESVDVFICSHVLEHVSDDQVAMRELARILKRGGWGIVLVPISRRLADTREELAPTATDRLRLYGQNDHVRLHTRSSLVQRLERAGFHVTQLGIEHFGTAVFEIAGITPTSILYVVEKSG